MLEWGNTYVSILHRWRLAFPSCPSSWLLSVQINT